MNQSRCLESPPHRTNQLDVPRLIFFATPFLELDKVEKCGPRTLNQKQPRCRRMDGGRTGGNVVECGALRVLYCEPPGEWRVVLWNKFLCNQVGE